MCVENSEDCTQPMPICRGPNCNKQHPLTGYKITYTINWPSRAFREPDIREGEAVIEWFKKCSRILEDELRNTYDVTFNSDISKW